MQAKSDNSVDILNIMRGGSKSKPGTPGLRVVIVSTADPDPLKFVFEGTPLALDPEIFEIPISLYPLKTGDRILAYSLLGQGLSQRWGLLTKLNGGPIYMATMQGANSLKIDGVDKIYTSQDLIIPSFVPVSNKELNGYLSAGDIRPLQAGDRVSIAAVWDGGKIKYIVTGKY